MGEQAISARHGRLWFSGLLAAAVALRLVAFNSYSAHHPDELFQYLEQSHRIVFGYGFVPWEFREFIRSWLIPVPLGVALASFVAAYVSGAGLRAIFAGIAFIVALRLIFNRESWRLGTEVPHGPIRAFAGAAIGFLSTLMGIGGGVLSNTFMTVYGRPIHQAVATAAGVGILIAIPGTLGYIAAGWGAEGLPPFSVGYVNLLGVAIVMPLSLLMAPLGVRIAHALTKRQLEVGFGIFLLLMSARFAYSLL